jgi:putative membrane protein
MVVSQHQFTKEVQMAADPSNSHFILHWLVSGLGVYFTAMLVPGFEISGFVIACFAALIIGLANAILWPVLFFLTLPINLLTLGLFTFILNGALIKISAALMPGFSVNSWLSAIFGAIVLSIVSMVLHYFLL